MFCLWDHALAVTIQIRGDMLSSQSSMTEQCLPFEEREKKLTEHFDDLSPSAILHSHLPSSAATVLSQVPTGLPPFSPQMKAHD